MKKLTERFDEIILEMRKRKADDVTLRLFLINAVKERDKFVLGEDEKSGECLCVKYKRAEESL